MPVGAETGKEVSSVDGVGVLAGFGVFCGGSGLGNGEEL